MHPEQSGTSYLYRRHPLALRVLHWLNALAVFLLLMSGLQIFNAHPALYWGASSYTGAGPVVAMRAERTADGALVGVTRLGSLSFDTTGVLGVSAGPNGSPIVRGFPAWSTVPSQQWLAMGRRWHFFFAWLLVVNGALYVLYALASRHLQRQLAPRRADWRTLGRTLRDHLLLRHPRGEAARRYNLLQQLAYLGLMFVALPAMVVTGLAMSPRLNAAWPGWIDLLGGRQSARTLHFLVATLVALFIFIHLVQVVLTGPWNNLRSMLTGNYRIRRGAPPGAEGER